ncbi:MAG: D-alanine--D-alanine ligase family protein, partial [Thermodesulfobacteriota bacterium]
MSEGKHLVTEKRIGVIMGGSSSEREVSLNSGRPVAKALSDRGYTVIPLEITNETLYHRLLEEKVDVAFLALHGGAGENGAVQGLLEVMGIPYTGSGILASALAMDKVMSKRVFEAAGLKVAACTVFEGSGIPNYHEIASRLGTPVVVKPAAEGSSIGVSIVRS